MNKRPLTLTGTVLCTVLFSILSLYQILQFIILSFANAVLSGENVGDGLITNLVTFSFISLIIYIVCLVLNACTISAGSANSQKYKSKRGLIITTAVFNILAFLYSFGVIIFQFVSYFNPFTIVSFVMQIGILIGGIFLLVDLAKEKQRIADNNLVDTSPQVVSTNEIDAMTQELNKLNALKQTGVISEEEYQQLKHKILLKY